MPAASKLIVFTYSYPYGFGEEWKYNEFKELSKHFEHITIQPFSYGNDKDIKRELPSNVSLNKPLITEHLNLPKLLLNGVLNKAPLKFAMQEFFFRKPYKNLKQLKFWLDSTLIIRHLATHPFIKKLTGLKLKDTVIYFYWGTGPALLAPLLNPDNFSKVVAKFHGGDLYEERTNGYLPFRKTIFDTLTHALFISEQGLKYAEIKYGIKNGGVFRLGVVSKGKSKYSQDNTLRIVTCSSAIPVKRLNLLIEALHHVTIPVVWTHIGDGPLLSSLKQAATSLPSHVSATFLGFMPAQEVQLFYSDSVIDLFINVSESEGVPVSVMEALSAGIPIIATNVGGTGEIVDTSNGKLLPSDVSKFVLADELSCFYNLSLPHKLELRKGAYKMYEERCNAVYLYEKLAHFLLKQ